ncbi:MAG: FecR domain-containing protein [Deltaproteobacteria bacterium]|nr:FecR domain-containing protein [Deltaproteobacteria bacterium]
MNYSFTKTVLQRFAVVLGFLPMLLVISKPLQAQERYPAVARISYVSGPVSYSRGDYPNEWDGAAVNVPFTLGDRIYLPEDGRAELQLPSGNVIRLAPRSYFSALNLAHDVKQFYLGEGAAFFNIRRLASDEIIEIDTPNVSVTLEQEGRYRVEVDENGNSRISVRRGKVIVAASGRQITMGEGELRVYGIDSPRYEVVAPRNADGFDRWVAEREARYERAYPDAYRYASDQIIGVEDLSEHGRWEEIPEYGYAWTPSRVAAGWAPYSVGRWFWQDPWGWSWISDEPWGWATCHYGRWTPYRSRWYWVPIRPRTRVVRYAPAVVEFVRVRDHIGWFPLHPRDRFNPWWDRRGRQNVTQNITYVNRTYVTIVNQNTFVSARNVTNNVVRDSVLVREASSVRVIEQPLPIPNRSSLRVAGEKERPRGQQPPATILSRAAVVRTALPPPPPTFEQKLPEIQKGQGKPVAPAAAAELALKNAQSSRRIDIRPAAVEASRADFAPRNPRASALAPQPLTEARGKKLATPEAPFVTKLPQKMERPDESPAQKERARQAPIEPPKGPPTPPELKQKQEQREQARQQRQQQEQERKEKAQQARELERKQQQEQERLRQEKQVQQQKERELRRQQQAEEARQKSLERQRNEQQQVQKQQQAQELERKQAQERRRQDKQILEQKRKEQEQVRKEQRPRELERKQQQEQAGQKQPPPREPRRKEQPEPRKQQPQQERERRQE